MMEVKSEIRKTPLFRTINPEKMINQIYYLKNPPNDPSSSEYFRKPLFNVKTLKLFPNCWLFNPAVTPSKHCASNLQSAKNCQKIPKYSRAPPSSSRRNPNPPDLPVPLPAAPEQLVASGSEDGAQEIGERGEEERGTAADRGMDPQ
jgi:hypothetical protein